LSGGPTGTTRAHVPGDSIWGNRPFMLLWAAQAISQTAQNAIWFALMVMVEQATQSTAQLGIAIVAYILPAVLFTVPAGVLIDRIDKRLVLILTNWVRAVIVLGYIFFSDSLVTIYAVTFVFSVISQFFLPAEAAMIPALVDRRRLISANSLFNLTFTLSQLAGIVLMAPIVIRLFGMQPLFIMISVLLVICGFVCVPLPSGASARVRQASQNGGRAIRSFMADLRETWDFIAADRMATMALASLTIGATLSLVTAMIAPRYMVAVIGILAEDTVFVLAPAGVGLAIGAATMGRLSRWVPKELLVLVGMGGVALGLLLLAIINPLWDFIFYGLLALLTNPETLPRIVSEVSMVGLVAGVTGLSLSMILIPSQTILQEQAPIASRGRIFAVQIMLGNVASIVPLVFIGGLADLIGVPQVLVVLSAGVVGIGYVASRVFRDRIFGPRV
jgi:MFS family permease